MRSRSRFVLRIWTTALVVVCLDTRHSQAELPHFQDDFALHALHLSPQVRELQIDRPSGLEGNFSTQWGNSFYDWDEGRIDAESVLIAARLSYHNQSAYELAIAPRFSWSGSGRLDSVIEDWHHFFGLPNGRRQDAEQDQYIVFSQSDQGAFQLERHSIELSGTTLEFQAPLAQELALRTRVDLPAEYGHDSLDGDLTLLYSRNFERFELYAGVGQLYFADTEISAVEFKQLSANGFLGVQVDLFDHASFSSVVSVAQEAIKNVAALPRAYVYLDCGFEFDVSKNTFIGLAIRENPYGARATSDVVGMLDVRRKFEL